MTKVGSHGRSSWQICNVMSCARVTGHECSSNSATNMSDTRPKSRIDLLLFSGSNFSLSWATVRNRLKEIGLVWTFFDLVTRAQLMTYRNLSRSKKLTKMIGLVWKFLLSGHTRGTWHDMTNFSFNVMSCARLTRPLHNIETSSLTDRL